MASSRGCTPLALLLTAVLTPVSVSISTPLGAQSPDPDHRLTLFSSVGIAEDPTVSVNALYWNLTETGISGWSWGVCTLTPEIAHVVSVVEGPDTLVVNGGDPPDFQVIEVYPDEGWTVEVIIDLTGENLLGNGYHQLYQATYEVLQSGVCPIEHCDVIGIPGVPVLIYDAEGEPIVPTTFGEEILSTVEQPPFIFHAPNAALHYDLATGQGEVTCTVAFSESEPYLGFETQGFSFGLAHDPAMLSVVPGSIEPSEDLEIVLNGQPDFFAYAIEDGGWTLGVVYSFYYSVVVFPLAPDAIGVATVSYASNAANLAGNELGETTELTWQENLGVPAVSNVIVVNGQGLGITGLPGMIELIPGSTFVRGDCNDDGAVNIADGIFVLAELFLGGTASGCAEACDANGDGNRGVDDAIAIFGYQLLDGPPPPAPFPGCGGETGDDCETFLTCGG